MEQELGKITHFFDKISVAVLRIEEGSLNVGDKIHVKGAITDFLQTVDSMQVEHRSVESAKSGDAIGMKTAEPVRAGDIVFKVSA